MKLDADIDIDFGDRDKLLKLISHTSAAMRNVRPMRKHNTGVYVTDVPYDPVNDMAAIDYTDAEKRGYFKLDLLNVHVYEQVKDEHHLIELMAEQFPFMLKKITDEGGENTFVIKNVHDMEMYQEQYDSWIILHRTL